MIPISPLHLFLHYLPPTQNWACQLIRHLPDTENHIAARYYLKTNFYHPDLHFFDNYQDGVTRYDHSLLWSDWKAWLPKAWIKALRLWMGNEIYWLLKYIEENKIEILHAHFAPAAVFYKKLKTKTGLPFVVSFYGYDYEKALHDHPEFRKQYQALFRLADAFICEGPHGAGVLREMGCPKEKVHVVPLGVEVEQIPFYKREKRAGELKLVQVASFTEKKGHIYTVKAFAAALKDCPNMSLTLVGDERRPGVKQQVLDYIKKEKLGQKLTVLDWVDYDHLHEFLEPFHVFIHPSCYASDRDCEGGAPVILLEAQATGMPVISTTHCDIPNIVKDDETGILCPEKEVERLAEAIAYFYGLPGEEYQEWGIRARRWVEERFEMAAQGRRLSKVYSTLCKMGR